MLNKFKYGLTMDENLKVQGYFLVDVDVVALNNAGKNTISNFDNAVATKVIYKNGLPYPYVSGQAVRFWWRDTLQKHCGWVLSPVIREEKVSYTQADPVKYPDDDVFGYMKTASKTKESEKKKKKGGDITVTRVSPLKNSALISVCSVRPVENWSSMARGEGDSVPYSKQEYSAVMKGMFSLDLNMVGTFSDYNKTGYLNLSQRLKKEALEAGCEELDDRYAPGKKMIRMPLKERVSRVVSTLKALKNISGGAMQTSNMGDVTPKFIILATTNSGNHPFSHVVSSYGERDEMAKFSVEALNEVLSEYKDDFIGKIFIGRRAGFWDGMEQDLKNLQQQYAETVVYGSVNEIIDKYCEQVATQMK